MLNVFTWTFLSSCPIYYFLVFTCIVLLWFVRLYKKLRLCQSKFTSLHYLSDNLWLLFNVIVLKARDNAIISWQSYYLSLDESVWKVDLSLYNRRLKLLMPILFCNAMYKGMICVNFFITLVCRSWHEMRVENHQIVFVEFVRLII